METELREDEEIVQWRFAGIRLDSKGKKANLFIDGEGKRHIFTMSRGDKTFVIGSRYNVKVKNGGSSAFINTAEFDSHIDDDQRMLWAAEDREAKVVQQKEAAEKAAKSESGQISEMTLAQANVFIHSGPWATQTARLAVVLKQLGVV